MDEQVILVSLVIKAPNRRSAESEIHVRLNDWFLDKKCQLPDGRHLDGTLLHWNFYEPKVVNAL